MQENANHDRPATTCKVALAQFSGSPKENPYVWQLGTALRDIGVDVLPMPGSAFFLVNGPAARNAEVIHFQWFEVLIGAPSLLKMLVKSAAFLLQLIACRLAGKRLVWTIHNLQSHEARHPRLEHWVARRMARHVDVMIVHCERARGDAARHLGIPVDRIISIDHGHFIGLYPNTVDRREARERLGIAPDEAVLLFFGNIRPYKGLDDLVRCFKATSEPRIRLVIAGRPVDDDAARQTREICDGDPRILLKAGFVPDDDLQIYFNACDVTVFPYRNILASGAVILAMSFGRACIAPSLGCIPGVLEKRSNFLYDPGQPDGLAEALGRALSSRHELARMGEANLDAARKLDWPTIAARTAAAYRRVDNMCA